MFYVFVVFDIVRVDAFVGLLCGYYCSDWVDVLFVILRSGDFLHWIWLFTWLQLKLSLVVINFCCCFFSTWCLEWYLGLHNVSSWKFFFLRFEVKYFELSCT